MRHVNAGLCQCIQCRRLTYGCTATAHGIVSMLVTKEKKDIWTCVLHDNRSVQLIACVAVVDNLDLYANPLGTIRCLSLAQSAHIMFQKPRILIQIAHDSGNHGRSLAGRVILSCLSEN